MDAGIEMRLYVIQTGRKPKHAVIQSTRSKQLRLEEKLETQEA